jgi:hypothetical protein
MNQPRTNSDEFTRKLWRFFWPLVFVVVMTLLSQFGPQLFSSGPSAAATPVASQQATQSIR